tara:strand:+ start:152 stop:328 length:177 start_codon:yes stop_codon:yes gene_type:complete
MLNIDYSDDNGYQSIAFYEVLENSSAPPTLIYDMYWNNQGRELIALKISNYLNEKLNL